MNQSITVTSFNTGWSFLKTAPGTELAEALSRKAEFSPITIPHDWLIFDAKNLYEDSFGWYRKELFVSEEELNAKGGWQLRFDGVYMDSTLYVNGKKVGDWKYGYSTFSFDITAFLQAGENEIYLVARHLSPNSRWYSGAGIYRDVWLKRYGEAYLPFDGTYVSSRPAREGDLSAFVIELETEVAYFAKAPAKMSSKVPCAEEARAEEACAEEACAEKATLPVFCTYRLYDGDKLVADLGTVTVEADSKARLSTVIKAPKLWTLENPACYTLQVLLVDETKGYQEESRNGLLPLVDASCEAGGALVIDTQTYTIGFRTLSFTPNEGFFLNGSRTKLHGVCEHHDLGCLGAAYHQEAMARKLHILRGMGVNAIRTSHNMPAPGFMELCDKEGFLVLHEAFDMWERSKTTYDYGRFFKEWAAADVASWVRRDRNHPSLLLWSIGNEIYDTHADAYGQEITRRLIGYVREHDPKANAQITIGSNYMPWENAQKCADIVKIAGYNYGEKYYDAHHEKYPDWIMYGSETSSIVQSRGVYHFPLKQSILADEDQQCSALGNSATSWGAKSIEKCITDDRDAEYTFGQFLWTGFDYIGEPTPYHTKNSYFGQIDTAGFPKDAYYIFKGNWTDVEKDPFVHLFPYWDFNEGQIIDVRAATNAPKVELFVNGISYGVQEIDHAHGKKLLGDWQVPYAAGCIEAVAFDEKGREIARDKRESFTDTVGFTYKLLYGDNRAASDSEVSSAFADAKAPTSAGCVFSGGKQDASKLYFYEINAYDAKGRLVENAMDYVTVKVENGRLLGMDNGDSTDTDAYQSDTRKLFNGKLLAVVEAEAQAQEEASAQGQKEDSAPVLHIAPACTAQEGSVPVRKILLSPCDTFRAHKKEQIITATIYPAAAAKGVQLIWKVVTDAGIDVPFAKIEPLENNAAKITVFGDGDFRIRCMAKEKNGKITIISQREAKAEGLGVSFLNPYAFVSAGLYSGSVGEIGNGNEKGIATARDGISGVYFENIDFGSFGADTITLPVFALSDDLYEIKVWNGKPYGEGVALLDTLQYQKPSRWNVYQEEAYKLPNRIKGIGALGFSLENKVHLKGFSFAKQEKAYAYLSMGKDADRVYGDSFRVEADGIYDIGNNVTVELEDMDFGEKGACRVTIKGRTPLKTNTIHLHFTPDGGETRNDILEFAGSDSTSVQTFALPVLTGRGKVEFIFLPGSQFDLEEVQFS